MKITGLNISDFVINLVWWRIFNRNCEEIIELFSFLIHHIVLTL